MPALKIIQIEDKFIDRSYDYPYMLKHSQDIQFSLRSNKVYSYRPIMLIEDQKFNRSLLPLSKGDTLKRVRSEQCCQVVEGNFTQDGEWLCTINPSSPGLVHFQLVFLCQESDVVEDVGEFDAMLVLQRKFQLRKLRKQTIFPRCIGNIRKWKDFLKGEISLGYNAFHFAPIQQTGASLSYYSIKHQHQLSSDIFEGSNTEKYKQLNNLLSHFQKDGIAFFVDIVLNHTSFDSEWIKEDINSVYTTQNTPILQSAFILDRALLDWGNELKANFDHADHISQEEYQQISVSLTSLVEGLKLEEFFELNLDVASEFLNLVAPSKPSDNIFAPDPSEIILDFLLTHTSCLGSGRKEVKVIDLKDWAQLNICYEQSDLLLGIEKFNNQWRKRIVEEWVPEIIGNIKLEIKNNYVDHSYRSKKDLYPFLNSYFSSIRLKNGNLAYALNNGWAMNVDTTENLVTTKNFYYLRRRVNVWGDLVRIRYSEDSCAWKHMEQYIKLMAENFDGFRLDNLHGTPLDVARHMINYARSVKPEIIIFAELFTSSDNETAMFCRQGGLNSILSELKHKLSGNQFLQLFHTAMANHKQYTGSLNPYFTKRGRNVKYGYRKKPVPLIYDLTHDNKTYEDSGKIILKTPICVLLELSGTFVGSTKGFDQFFTNKISVTEKRDLYFHKNKLPIIKTVNPNKFIHKLFCECKFETCSIQVFGSWDEWKQPIILKMERKGMKEASLELPEGDYEYKFKVDGEWTIDPHKPVNSNGNHFFTILQSARTIYENLEGLRTKTQHFREKYFCYKEYYGANDGDIVYMIRESKDYENAVYIIANLSTQPQTLHSNLELPGILKNADVWIQSQFSLYGGLTTSVEITNHSNLNQYFDLYHREVDGKDILVGSVLPPGFACVIDCLKNEKISQSIRGIKELRSQSIKLPPLGCLDYNFLMFGIDQEEMVKYNSENYFIPKENRKLIFGGFAGILGQIERAKRHNDLSLPLFDNIREGDWLCDYYLNRLKNHKHLTEVTEIISRYFQNLKTLPSYLKPKFFASFIYDFCCQAEKQASRNSNSNSNNQLRNKLYLASCQFISKFDKAAPEFRVSISAGLPHFSTGWSRCWGRDTFIANELLLLHPNIYRDVILQFASTLRHGLIPNLLDFGHKPRYNCRDACWWFVRSVKEYALKTKDYEIFKTKVNMLFLSDDAFEHSERLSRGEKKVMLVEEVIQAIFQNHANGISFREWNAGYEIDSNMSAEGFTIKLIVDEDTGFINGGSPHNCLTWMDKMGSSAKANNKGVPATPRAGSPIELTGLLYHCLVSYSKLHLEGHYSFKSVSFKKRDITFDYWAELISNNFQKQYYIDENSFQTKYNKIYKDVVNSPEKIYYEEYRLRPNALIALTLAPELFNKQHAHNYLQAVQQYLIFPHSIGVSTLGEAHDTMYSPYYDNNDDSSDSRLAHGFSYHNGPEWVWPYGFYISAKCNFQKGLKREQLYGLLQNQYKHIQHDEWRSLPELTNHNGERNHFSCPSQAWSISSLILAMERIEKYEEA